MLKQWFLSRNRIVKIEKKVKKIFLYIHCDTQIFKLKLVNQNNRILWLIKLLNCLTMKTES